MDKRFGDLEHARPATLWKSETSDFLPWLAAEDNLCRLGRALGLDLESVAREVPVGRFRADILCRDRSTGGAVVIEAQLGHSDHAHLGQVLAYATGLSDAAAVWIATRFHKEHCAIVERLNSPDGAGYRCFAVEMRLWKIGASLIAPQFNVLARPGARSVPVGSAGDRASGAGVAPLPVHAADLASLAASPIRIRRLSRGLSMKQLAQAAGISTVTLSHIETGRRRGSFETRAALAKALDLPIDLLS